MSDPPRETRIVRTTSAAETEALAARLAEELQPGDIITLSGDLGAGKTTFTRGLVRGLGSSALVSSPTFALVHEYSGGRLPAVHVDAYRLSGLADAQSAGLDEYLSRNDTVLIVEWPENIADLLPEERMGVELADDENDARQITLTPHGARWNRSGSC